MRILWRFWLKVTRLLGSLQMFLLLSVLYVLFYPVLHLMERSTKGKWIEKTSKVDMVGQG